jgi:chemotaxis protein methyltransferase CheR
VLRRLAAILKPGGYLLVGATETLFHDLGILTLIERDGLYLFRKGDGPGIREPRQPGAPRARPAVPAAAGRPSRRLTQGLFEDALECARSRREAPALTLLDALLELQPGHARAHALKAGVLLAAARHEEARAACDAALALDPLCLEACLMLGVIARRRGDDLAALKRFREAIYLDPSCWFAHYSQAEVLLARGEGPRSRAGFEAALRLLAAGTSPQGFYPLSSSAADFSSRCRRQLALLQNAP